MIAITEILESINKTLNNSAYTDEEKLDAIIEAAFPIDKAKSKIINRSDGFARHLAKQLQYKDFGKCGWIKEMASGKYLGYWTGLLIKDDRPVSKEDFKKWVIDGVSSELDAKVRMREARKDVQSGAKANQCIVTELNIIEPKQFLRIWENFIECIADKFEFEKEYQEEEIIACIDHAVEKVMGIHSFMRSVINYK